MQLLSGGQGVLVAEEPHNAKDRLVKKAKGEKHHDDYVEYRYGCDLWLGHEDNLRRVFPYTAKVYAHQPLRCREVAVLYEDYRYVQADCRQ